MEESGPLSMVGGKHVVFLARLGDAAHSQDTWRPIVCLLVQAHPPEAIFRLQGVILSFPQGLGILVVVFCCFLNGTPGIRKQHPPPMLPIHTVHPGLSGHSP